MEVVDAARWILKQVPNYKHRTPEMATNTHQKLEEKYSYMKLQNSQGIYIYGRVKPLYKTKLGFEINVVT